MTTALSDTFNTFNGSFVRLLDYNRSLVEKTLRVTQEESLRFINRRLERNARILENLREKESLTELIAAEQDWLADAARDYMETSEKLRGRLFELATSGIKEASEQGQSAAETFRGATAEVAAKTRRNVEAAQKQAAE